MNEVNIPAELLAQDMQRGDNPRPLHLILSIVNNWAKQAIPGDYYNSSRRVYFREAMNNGIINKSEFDRAAEHYANLWTYVGD